MKWSDGLRETREDVEATIEVILNVVGSTAGELADEAQRRLGAAQDRLRRMMDALRNDPDDIE